MERMIYEENGKYNLDYEAMIRMALQRGIPVDAAEINYEKEAEQKGGYEYEPSSIRVPAH